MTEQLAFPAQVWPCPRCPGSGRIEDPETDELCTCPACGGWGHVDWQPSTSANPFEHMETQT